MEKDSDSMTTVAMKPEYPPSEYSASEPPPAYRQRPSSAVQIARIAAITIVASSFILGSFILASSWVSARAGCQQLEQLDAMLDKELALEGRSYGNDGLVADEPLPVGNAHALHSLPPSLQPPAPPAPAAASQSKEDALHQAESKLNEDKLQTLDDSRENSKDESPAEDSSEEDSDSKDNSGEDEDELDVIRPSVLKMPIQFDLDDIAGAFLNNNQRGRMNCVVERRHEEPMERRFPFNILGSFMPRSNQAERIAIICHGGDQDSRPMGGFPDPAAQVFAFPLAGPARLPLRPPPAPMSPPAPMPPMQPMPQHRQSPFPMPMPWDSSEEMVAPREMRIHVQRVIAIPGPHGPHGPRPAPEAMGPFPPPPAPQHDQNEQPSVIHQFVPQPAPTQELEQPEMQMDDGPVSMGLPWGLTPEDLRAIHRTAQGVVADAQREQREQREQQIDNDMQEVKTIVNTLAAAAAAEAEDSHRMQMGESHQQMDDMPRQMIDVPRQMIEIPRQINDMPHQMVDMSQQMGDMQRQMVDRPMPIGDMPRQMGQMPRQIVEMPRQMNEMPRHIAPEVQQLQEGPAPPAMLVQHELPLEERPHYVQPRSVRSVDAFHHREKRVKRFACSCE